MSEPSVLPGTAPRHAGHRAKKKRSGCLPMLVFLLVASLLIASAGWFVVRPWVNDLFADPEDYPGPGSGEVMFVVDQGQTVTSMGEELEDLGVVASQDAFVDAAASDDRSTSIQAGTYVVRKKMKAADVVAILVNPKNVAQNMVTLPEGLRVADIVPRLADSSEFSEGQFRKVLRRPKSIGLPKYADGNPEGYLFPATYAISPSDTPTTILKSMVDRWRQSAESLDIESDAQALGYTPHEIMTVAALVEAEGRGDDMPKIARVIYNRLENPGTAGQIGRLQIDATVDYALDRPLTVGLTQEERDTTESPYNTFLNVGLPPGPIGNPGEDAIRAALRPAEGDWYYYVTVNLKTGETKFAESYPEFERYRDELREYCATKSEAC